MATAPQSGNQDSKSLRAFLCHSSADKALVRELCIRLESDGVQPWLDEKNLLGGQDFQQEIQNAVRASDVVIICLSKTSTTKSGFVQREIKYAMELAQEQPEGAIFLIPLRLEECDVPQSLGKLHWIDYFNPDGYQHLKRALDFRAQALKKHPTNNSNTENRSVEPQMLDVRSSNDALRPKRWFASVISSFVILILAITGFLQYRQMQALKKPAINFRATLAPFGSARVIRVPRDATISLDADVATGDYSKYKVLILGEGQQLSADSPNTPNGHVSVSMSSGALQPGDYFLVVQGEKRDGETLDLGRFPFSLQFSD